MRLPEQLDVTSLDLRADERKRIQQLWDRFRPYADANFAQELVGHFLERYWEMCLVYVILRRGMRLQERSTAGGPDIGVQNPGAINPLRHGWLRLGRECWMSENTLYIKSWSRSRKG